MSIAITARNAAGGPRKRVTRGPMTPVTRVRHNTFAAPVSDPGGRQRLETWVATSRDGLWRYERDDDGATTPWSVTYLPTGQARDGYGQLDDAREATAGRLLDELRAVAYGAALGPEPTVDGHRWLAVHMRIVGGDESDYRCECGGLLVKATRNGSRLAHVDACDECHTHGKAGITAGCSGSHMFCAAPTPVGCAHGCGSPAAPSGGAGCGYAGMVDCCEACCHGAD